MSSKDKEDLKKKVNSFIEQDYDAGMLFGYHSNADDEPINGRAFFALNREQILYSLFTIFENFEQVGMSPEVIVSLYRKQQSNSYEDED